MEKTISFKQYMNDGKYSFYEFPHFLVDPEEEKYNNTTFKAKLLYFFMYNRTISAFTEKDTDENGNSYFTLTTDEIANFLNATENTARKYKKELVDKNLMLEITSRGQKATRYAINQDLALKNEELIYTV